MSIDNQLRDFILNNKGKKIVAVQGLGFVGSVMSLVCANAINGDYSVLGVDLPTPKGKEIIDGLNNGVFPLIANDPKIKELFEATMKKKNFFASYDNNAFKFADIIIIDVNLDVDKKNSHTGILKSYNVDLEPFKKAIFSIGENCKKDALILIETTVPPGTSKNVVWPIIKECLLKRKKPINEIKIGHSYERVMPGPNYVDSIQNFYRVYSGINEESANATEEFLKTIIRTDEYPLTRLQSTNATEMAKVLENSYRAMNISFMVEWSRFAEESGVNLYEVVDAIRLRPTHSNLMFPGIGVGGYCLTKDALLASWSRQNLFKKDNPKLVQSENAININDQMPRYAFEFLQKNFSSLKNKKILFLGVSYRGDVGDTRSSPVKLLYDLLLKENANIFCHDPYVEFWDEQSIAIDSDLVNLFSNSPEIVIISSGHSVFYNKKTIQSLYNTDSTFIFDTIGLLNDDQIKFLSKKHIVKVLGRGDI